MSNIYIILIGSILIAGISAKEEIQQWIYQNIDNYAVNFRNLNGTHEFGSSSSINGAYGVVHLVYSRENASVLIDQGLAGPYVVVLLENSFTEDVMNILNSDKIAGVVVTTNPNSPSNYSFDSTCPNSNGADCKVNPYGNSFLLKKWPFPVVLIEDSASIKTIVKCFNDFNLPFDPSQLTRRLCSLHLKNHMFAAVNSEVCIRRNIYSVFNGMKFCDPLGGQNIILPLGNFWTSKKETLILSARLDVASLFDGIAPGAMSSVTGIVTLLAAANVFKNMLPQNYTGDKSVIFILLNGEAYDYIGSSRIAFDMQKGMFPGQGNDLDLKDLSLFVDINQISNHPLFLHTNNEDNPVAKMFLEKFISFGSANHLNWSDVNFEPDMPSSYHSFLKLSSSLPGIVLSNYRSEFSNRFYHGLYDNSENIKFIYQNGSEIDTNSVQYYIGKVAEGLAVSLFKYMTGQDYDTDLLQNNSTASLVDELLHCYLESNHCKYMQAVITKDIKIKEEPESLYVGVGRGSDVITKLTGRMLAYLTSPVISASIDNCTNNETMKSYSYIWMNGLTGTGECVNSTLMFTPAVSPAFDIEDYNWTSGEYSTWTESAWQDLDVFLFLKPPTSQDLVTLITGLTVLVSSFVLVYWLNKDLRHASVQNSPCF